VYFLGSKGGRCVRLTSLPTSCAVVMNSVNLNFLESAGPLQACNGTALPLTLLKIDSCRHGGSKSRLNSRDEDCLPSQTRLFATRCCNTQYLMLPIDLKVRETCISTLRKGHGVRASRNRMRTRIRGRKRNEVTGR
jgi:hypothetical protein